MAHPELGARSRGKSCPYVLEDDHLGGCPVHLVASVTDRDALVSVTIAGVRKPNIVWDSPMGTSKVIEMEEVTLFDMFLGV